MAVVVRNWNDYRIIDGSVRVCRSSRLGLLRHVVVVTLDVNLETGDRLLLLLLLLVSVDVCASHSAAAPLSRRRSCSVDGRGRRAAPSSRRDMDRRRALCSCAGVSRLWNTIAALVCLRRRQRG